MNGLRRNDDAMKTNAGSQKNYWHKYPSNKWLRKKAGITTRSGWFVCLVVVDTSGSLNKSIHISFN